MTLEILHDDTALLKFKPHRISHQLEVELATQGWYFKINLQQKGK